MSNNNLISVIVTTYNWPSALDLVLKSYEQQSDTNFELIIADDGSDEKTRSVIDSFKSSSAIKIKHVWHEDKGFRASKIRNRAALEATGDYLIFSDGDCLALPHFIKHHRRHQQPGYFVAGNRILLEKKYTEQILAAKALITQKPWPSYLAAKLKGQINRFLPFLPLPLSFKSRKWQGAKTCNLAVWKEDFVAVNGFEERFEGWGYEDSDLVIRLFKSGKSRKSVKLGLPVLHLWHPENSRHHAADNLKALRETEKKQSYKAVLGLEAKPS